MNSEKRALRTLILGLGNVLMGDEGVGISAIEYLSQKEIPEGVDLLDGGTGGFHLLSLFGEYDHLILIDATIGTGQTGEVTVLQPRFASDFPRSLTSHDIGLKDLVQSAELLGDMPEIHLITIQVEDYRKVGIGLSGNLEESFGKVYEAVIEILAVNGS